MTFVFNLNSCLGMGMT